MDFTKCYISYILLHILHSVTRFTFCYVSNILLHRIQLVTLSNILLHFRQPNFIDLEKANLEGKK